MEDHFTLIKTTSPHDNQKHLFTISKQEEDAVLKIECYKAKLTARSLLLDLFEASDCDECIGDFTTCVKEMNENCTFEVKNEQECVAMFHVESFKEVKEYAHQIRNPVVELINHAIQLKEQQQFIDYLLCGKITMEYHIAIQDESVQSPDILNYIERVLSVYCQGRRGGLLETIQYIIEKPVSEEMFDILVIQMDHFNEFESLLHDLELIVNRGISILFIINQYSKQFALFEKYVMDHSQFKFKHHIHTMRHSGDTSALSIIPHQFIHHITKYC